MSNIWLLCRERLEQGLEQMGLQLPEEAPARLVDYLRLMHQWNKAYNLTAVREPVEMVSRHLLDSLAVLPFIQGQNILDMGTGAGLPGIPLAIVRPELRVTLLDGNGKKIRFVRQVIMQLDLDQVMAIQQRAEAHTGRYQQITARAFSDLEELSRLASPLLEPEGEILALKGTFDTITKETMHMVPEHVKTHRLTIPFLHDQQRHLVILRKATG